MSREIPITVAQVTFDAVARATSNEFALSYLWNASESPSTLTPHTVTAYEALRRSYGARKALESIHITLHKPEPFPGYPPRPGVHELLPEAFARPERRGRRPEYDSW
jgi:hypothetical protein